MLSGKGFYFKGEIQEYNLYLQTHLFRKRAALTTVTLQANVAIEAAEFRANKAPGSVSIVVITSPPCHCLPVRFTESRKLQRQMQKCFKRQREEGMRRFRQSLDRGNELRLDELAGGLGRVSQQVCWPHVCLDDRDSCVLQPGVLVRIVSLVTRSRCGQRVGA